MNRVCKVSTVHSPNDQRIFHKQAKSLLNEGWDVSYVVHQGTAEVCEGVNLVSLGEANSRPKRWAHLPRSYKKAIEIDADIYHLHDPELLPVGYMLKLRTNAAVIFDMHEDYIGGKIIEGHREWIPPIARPIIAKSLPTVFKWFMKRIDAVVTTTQSMAYEVKKLGANRVKLVQNFPKVQNTVNESEIIDRDHECQLVYVGSLAQNRGIYRMLQTLDGLQNEMDIGLWLLGNFVDNKTESRVIDFIESNELNVRRFGYVEYENIFSILSAADIGFALLDKTLCEHNTPTKIFEYMLTETPYIGTDAPTIRQFSEEDYARLVSEGDIQTTMRLITSLFKDRDRIRDMGKEGRQKVKNEYNWEREFGKLLDLYDDVSR